MPRARLVTLLPLALLATGCGSKQSSLAPESPSAHGIATIWWIMLAGSGVGLAVIVGILVAAWFKREAPGRDRPGTITVLVLGVVTPILVLIALFAYSDIFLIRGTSPPVASAASRELTVRVTGHQFWWEVRYPGTNAVTANEIHIPVRTHVVMLVHTKDVIHSFWVPQLNRKIDMEPEQVNRVELFADRVGRYRGQCSEFCGLQHAHMGFYVFADPPAKFRQWLAREQKPASGAPPPLFMDKCSSCHAIRGTTASANVGPDLTHIGGRTSLAALTIPNTPVRMREWLRETQHVKPGSLMPDLNLTDAQVRQLTGYLEGLK
ncbi:MAG TPA: cytochrome c oxidase subunit II [Gaiellaceae bacterium]